MASPGDADAPEANAWVVGDAEEVIVIDPGRDAEAVLGAVGDREIVAVLPGHGEEMTMSAAQKQFGYPARRPPAAVWTT